MMLDKNYYPMYLYARDFTNAAVKAGEKPFEIALRRGEGEVARYSTVLYAEGHDDENFAYAERIIKFLLWAYGGKGRRTHPEQHMQPRREAYPGMEKGRGRAAPTGQRLIQLCPPSVPPRPSSPDIRLT